MQMGKLGLCSQKYAVVIYHKIKGLLNKLNIFYSVTPLFYESVTHRLIFINNFCIFVIYDLI